MDLEKKVRELVERTLEALGVKLYKIELTNESKECFLRLYIDKPGGTIDLDMIVKVSDAISPLFDESDILEGNYILDISSLGAERDIEINELASYIGQYIHVHIRNPIKGLNDYEGELISHNGEIITLQFRIKTRVQTVPIIVSEIDHVRLAIKF